MSQTQVPESTTEQEDTRATTLWPEGQGTTRPRRKGALARRREAQQHQASVSLGTQQIGSQAYAWNTLISSINMSNCCLHETLLHFSLQSSQHNWLFLVVVVVVGVGVVVAVVGVVLGVGVGVLLFCCATERNGKIKQVNKSKGQSQCTLKNRNWPLERRKDLTHSWVLTRVASLPHPTH